MIFSPIYFLYMLPAILLMAWAQWRIRHAYASGMEIPSPLSGAAAAQHILDAAGVHDVAIEQTPGFMSDHYDPQARVLRLSPEVYSSRTATAVGIAAHEAGHALQHAKHYAPLVLRNLAAPAAQFGGGIFMTLIFLGFLMHSIGLIWAGILAFGMVLVFQVVNLPVEFDASNRAKRLLREMNIVDADGHGAVVSVLNAAGWTYVAGTLQSVLTLMYYLSLIGGSRRDD
jgi:Zn-dependent membrane protease YugP